jgi:hypothetical protein
MRTAFSCCHFSDQIASFYLTCSNREWFLRASYRDAYDTKEPAGRVVNIAVIGPMPVGDLR